MCRCVCARADQGGRKGAEPGGGVGTKIREQGSTRRVVVPTLCLALRHESIFSPRRRVTNKKNFFANSSQLGSFHVSVCMCARANRCAACPGLPFANHKVCLRVSCYTSVYLSCDAVSPLLLTSLFKVMFLRSTFHGETSPRVKEKSTWEIRFRNKLFRQTTLRGVCQDGGTGAQPREDEKKVNRGSGRAKKPPLLSRIYETSCDVARRPRLFSFSCVYFAEDNLIKKRKENFAIQFVWARSGLRKCCAEQVAILLPSPRLFSLSRTCRRNSRGWLYIAAIANRQASLTTYSQLSS